MMERDAQYARKVQRLIDFQPDYMTQPVTEEPIND